MPGIGLLALDGADTIGGSKLLLRYDDRQLLLDFGRNFKRFGKYYEEYLWPRSAAGLLDYVEMEVLPDARNLYREDLMHPDLTLEGPDVGRIDAMLLSHAHADHFGDLGFLRLDIPMVTNAMSAAIVKAMGESMKSDLGKDYVCPSPRYESNSRSTVIVQSCTTKQAKEMNVKGRDIILPGGWIPDAFRGFWNMSPSVEMAESAAKARPHLPGELRSDLSALKVEPHPVDHSVKGATAYVIPTSQGNVVYTGDLRLHGLNHSLTEAFVRAARSPRPYALIIEGTRARRASDASTDAQPSAEEDVLENARSLAAGMGDRLVIADFGPRNIERLEIFLTVARENHRRMVITTKDAYLLHAMHTVDPGVPVPGDDIAIYDCPKGSEGKFEGYILDRVYPGLTVNGAEVGRSPGDYLMSFSFFDLKHLVDIRPDEGHYMYSSCEAFSEEQEIDFIRMSAWLRKYGLEPHGLSFEKDAHGDMRPAFPKGPGSLHASGHATKEDLARIVEAIDPEVVIPVHTESPGWFEEEFGNQRKVLLPASGSWVGLA